MMRDDGHEVGRHDGDVLKGLIAGLAGGLAAAFVMNQFQAALSKLITGEERGHGAQSMQQGAPQHGVGRALQARGHDDEDDDAAERVAAAVAEGVFDHKLTGREKETAGTVVHYAFGVTTGALYGATVELLPGSERGRGFALRRARVGCGGRRPCAALGAVEDAGRVPDGDTPLCVRVASGLRAERGDRSPRRPRRAVN